jgi:hypothetical protein
MSFFELTCKEKSMNIEINVNELFETVLANLPVQTIHPIHKAMLEEACEHVLKQKDEFESIEEMERAVHLSFTILNPIFQSTMISMLENADTVTINYRGVKDILTSESAILIPVN